MRIHFISTAVVCLILISCSNEKAEFDSAFAECVGKYDSADRRSEEFDVAINKVVKGKSIPDWNFTDLDGRSFSLHDVNKPVVLVNLTVGRGEGHSFVRAIHEWDCFNKDQIFIVINCNGDEETIKALSGPSWIQDAYNDTTTSTLALIQQNPDIHIVPGEAQKNGTSWYINGVNDDDGVCSIYYIGNDHRVKRYDSFGLLSEWMYGVSYSNAKDKSNRSDAYFDFMHKRIEKYLLNL